jgi:hypothetical protein
VWVNDTSLYLLGKRLSPFLYYYYFQKRTLGRMVKPGVRVQGARMTIKIEKSENSFVSQAIMQSFSKLINIV